MGKYGRVPKNLQVGKNSYVGNSTILLQDMKMQFEHDMHEARVKFQHVEKQNEILQKDNAVFRKLFIERG